MSSLISILRFSIVFQAIIAVVLHFFQWFAWNGDMALVWRGDVGDVKTAMLVTILTLTLGWWTYLSVLVWQLRRGMALGYVYFLILMPLIQTIGEPARDFPTGQSISGLDVLYYMNGAFILCLTSFTPLRRYFKIIPEPGTFEFLKNPRKVQRLFKIGAGFILLFGIIGQREHAKPSCCTKCCTKAKKEESAEPPESIEIAVPTRQ